MDIKMADFPILSKGRTYLDSAATSQKPYQVINALVRFYEDSNANVHRGIYETAEGASIKYEEAREEVARFIDAHPSEVVFTSGTTAGINFIADTWGKKNIKEGDEILVTQVEHHSNLLPWQRLAKEMGASLKCIPLDGKFNLTWRDCVTSRTKLVAISSHSNVLGPIWGEGELEDLIHRAHEVGAKVMLDAAQSIPHYSISTKKLAVDFLVFSGHKMLGPTGIGVLYINKGLHDEIEPYQVGGSMVHSVDFDKASWKKAPHKFEAGTPPIAQALALGEAIRYLTDNLDFEKLADYEASLCRKLLEGLKKFKGVRVLGNVERIKSCGHLVSFVFDGVHGHDVAAYLDKKRVSVRAGHHCAQPLHDLLNAGASIRASFYLYSTKKDVERLLSGLDEALRYLRRPQ